MKKKIGSQTPTLIYKKRYPKGHTKSDEAVALYEKTGKSLYKWQAGVLGDMMAYNKNGLWVHTKCGLAVPRRNGKSEILIPREMEGLEAGEKILHTAHRTTTSHSAWERVIDALELAGYHEGMHYRAKKQLGLETVEFVVGGGRINFRTRSSKGGLGEGYDLLVVDEAQEYTDDQQSALQYVVTDSDNPQIIMCGTPPTAVSSGTVFSKFREKCIAGEAQDAYWAEWSTETMADPGDKKVWYRTNPSLGLKLTERKIAAEDSSDVLDYNIQRFGYWTKHNLKSAISRPEWERLATDCTPELEKKLFVGVKFGNDGENAAMAIAARTADEKIFVEAVDCRPLKTGIDWIVEFLSAAKSVSSIVVDGTQGQILAKRLKEAGVRKKTVQPTVKEFVNANAIFEAAIIEETLCHKNQPSLTETASNCDKRKIGSGGGFGYKALKPDIEIALLDSVILAHWAAKEYKPPRQQRVGY